MLVNKKTKVVLKSVKYSRKVVPKSVKYSRKVVPKSVEVILCFIGNY